MWELQAETNKTVAEGKCDRIFIAEGEGRGEVREGRKGIEKRRKVVRGCIEGDAN